MNELTPRTPRPKTRVVDNPLAPDIFADAAIGFALRNGVVSLTLTSQHVDHTAAAGPINDVVIGRLVMPVIGAQQLAFGLSKFLKENGLASTPLRWIGPVQ